MILLKNQQNATYSSLSNKREHQINVDMGQKFQINKRGQWNNRGQWISYGISINVDMGKICIIKVDKGENIVSYSPE